MPDAPRWSLADTHCVWCEEPNGTCRCPGSSGAEGIALSLRATVEAQGKVIERYADGWLAWVVGPDKKPLGKWFTPAGHAEPMSPAEQVVLYGEVVNEEAGDG